MTPNVIRQEQVNSLLDECKVFWAFSNEQFEAGKLKSPLKEGEKYLDIGGGGYMPKGNLEAFEGGMEAITKEFNTAMKDAKARRDHIAYELSNHEAYYTHSIESTMDALGEDFTREEVANVFNIIRKTRNED